MARQEHKPLLSSVSTFFNNEKVTVSNYTPIPLVPRNGQTLRALIVERPRTTGHPPSSDQAFLDELRRCYDGEAILTRAGSADEATEQLSQNEFDVVLSKSAVSISRRVNEVELVVQASVRTNTVFLVADEEIDSRRPGWQEAFECAALSRSNFVARSNVFER